LQRQAGKAGAGNGPFQPERLLLGLIDLPRALVGKLQKLKPGRNLRALMRFKFRIRD
jgi:hypothetical protein